MRLWDTAKNTQMSSFNGPKKCVHCKNNLYVNEGFFKASVDNGGPFKATLRSGRNLKTQQSLFILGFCVRKIRVVKSHYTTDVLVFELISFVKWKCCRRPSTRKCGVFKLLQFEERWYWAPFSKLYLTNIWSLKSVFKTLRFHDGLAWTVGLNNRSKPAFWNSSCVVCTA